MIRRAFVRALSGAVFSAMLGVKVETWKLEVGEPESERVEAQWSDDAITWHPAIYDYESNVVSAPPGTPEPSYVRYFRARYAD